jgi:hypothetical protein
MVLVHGGDFIRGEMQCGLGDELLTMTAKRSSCGPRPKVIAKVLRYGANPNSVDQNGNTSLHHILSEMRHHDSDFTGLLVRKEDFRTTLLLLIEAGANINAMNAEGEVVSDIAFQHGNWIEWKEALKSCGYSEALVRNLYLSAAANSGQIQDMSDTKNEESLEEMEMEEYLDAFEALEIAEAIEAAELMEITKAVEAIETMEAMEATKASHVPSAG